MPELEISPMDEDAIIREVFNTDQVKAKTELTDLQIQTINKMGTLALLYNSDLMKQHINDFMILQKSRERKSLAEFVDSIKAKRQDLMNQGGSFFKNMLG